MKKWILAGVLALLVGYCDLLPFESMDAGEMLVVETLLVEAGEDSVHLYAQDLEGVGETVREAAEDMEATAPGQLFLRQTKRLVFCGGAEKQVDLLAIPWELPLGATVYTSDKEAEELIESLEQLEAMMKVREQRQKQAIPTLAQLENGALQQVKVQAVRLSEEDSGGNS